MPYLSTNGNADFIARKEGWTTGVLHTTWLPVTSWPNIHGSRMAAVSGNGCSIIGGITSSTGLAAIDRPKYMGAVKKRKQYYAGIFGILDVQYSWQT